MTITWIALLTTWFAVVPGAVVLLRLRAPRGAVGISDQRASGRNFDPVVPKGPFKARCLSGDPCRLTTR